MQAWCNHKIISVPDQATVSQLSPDFCLFETFALRNGRVESAIEHEVRLYSALRYLNLDKSKLHLNFSDKLQHWSPILKNLLVSEKLTDAIVRWVVVPNKEGNLTEWVTVRALPQTPVSIDLFLLKTARDNAEWLPRPKTGPWKNSQAALDELRKISTSPDVEGVQLDPHGKVSDCTRSALAWWDGAQWFAPSQETQCLTSTALQTLKNSFGGSKKINEVTASFPHHAQSLIVLRSTFAGGAVLINKVLNTDGEILWAQPANQSEAQSALKILSDFRVQRSVSLL